MSQGSFIVLLLIMWAVVATFYTVIFNVTSGPVQKPKESNAVQPASELTKKEHPLPHAA
ncbi:MAG TPA: hypothetical protein VMB25_27160 [Bryobacteraceae bacterium]|nr:hypothetical protein [Bryobacteraceae bacterium]